MFRIAHIFIVNIYLKQRYTLKICVALHDTLALNPDPSHVTFGVVKRFLTKKQLPCRKVWFHTLFIINSKCLCDSQCDSSLFGVSLFLLLRLNHLINNHKNNHILHILGGELLVSQIQPLLVCLERCRVAGPADYYIETSSRQHWCFQS